MGFRILNARDRKVVRRRLRTDCHVVAEDGFRFLGEHTNDLSTRGFCLQSEHDAELGESVVLSLRVPGGLSWIDAEARIVRVVRGLRQTDAGRAYGLRFEHMSTLDRALLAGSLWGKPPVPPARRLRRDYANAVLSLALIP